jgi:PhzF family phenazine biosynthesis protein
MQLPVYQVDAFASRAFGGNPAAVVCLDGWLEDNVLLMIAAEHNQPTTAFLVDRGAEFEIRYFLPIGELPLVGHASLAAAYVVLNRLRPQMPSAVLRRRNGALKVERLGQDMIAMQLPAVPPRPCPAPSGFAAAMKVPISEVLETDGQYFAVLADAAAVAAAAPDMDGLMRLDRDGVVLTARGTDCDFVSRAFAPKEGLPEDPVCGSAHLALVPFWSERLGRRTHRALQLSPRGGELHCALEDGQVRLAGRCALYLEGTIRL